MLEVESKSIFSVIGNIDITGNSIIPYFHNSKKRRQTKSEIVDLLENKYIILCLFLLEMEISP